MTAALPETYAGDTLKELPEMIAGARRKGFDKAATDLGEFEMTELGLVFLKTTRQGINVVNVSAPFEILGLVRDTTSSGRPICCGGATRTSVSTSSPRATSCC